MPTLYHFSEDPGLTSFEPRVTPTSSLAESLVWAIDAWHAPMYYFPRDCPRACFWPSLRTTPDDRERWFAGIDAKMVIAIESAWLERIRTTALYRYTMPSEGFVRHDETAGHWVCRETVVPTAAEPVGDLLAALVDANVELRVTPQLSELWQLVVASTLAYSGTRLRNAAP